MNALDRLTADIRVHLDRQEATGWFSIHCPVCGERRTKTGGFLFTPDSIHYKCFRGKCDGSCALVQGSPVGRKFKALMKLLGVVIPIDLLMVTRKSTLQSVLEDESHLFVKHTYNHIQLPDGFVGLDSCSDGVKQHVLQKFFDRSITSPKNLVYATGGEYRGLCGFEMTIGSKRIGMHVITNQGKYISIYGGNSHVIYSPSGRIQSPVILVEGGMDAMSFPNTVAVLGNRITPQQAYSLKGHDVIMLPDRAGGNEFISQCFEYGWKFCVPDWKEKDLNAAVMRYGKLVVAKKISESIYTTKLEAQLRYNLWTEDRN